MIFEPTPNLHPPTVLRDGEQAWIERRRLEAERAAAEAAQQRPRRLPGRMTRAADRWSVEAGWVALGLEHATVTTPPSSDSQGRRGTTVPDPTGAALSATLAQVEHAAGRFAHLAGPCPADRTRDDLGRLHECPDISATVIAGWLDLDLDPTPVVDDLLGVSPSQTVAFRQAVSSMAAWHSMAAAHLADGWTQAWRAGMENSKADTVATLMEQGARRMAGLAGELAGWSGRRERTCRTPGCDAAVDDPGEKWRRGEGRKCDRCLKRDSRERQASA